MDHKLSQVLKRSNTPDTEEHNGLTWQTGNESAENFSRVVGQFIHGNRGHTSHILQLSVHQSTDSVATSVATSVASSRDYMMPPSAIKAENQDLPPLNARKRVAESSTLPRKQRRHSSSASQIQGRSQVAAQEMHRKRPLPLTTIIRKLVSDTIQYLQTLSDRRAYLLTQLRTGHSWLSTYRKKIGYGDDDRCDCGAQETVTHVLVDCPRLVELRRNLRREVGDAFDSVSSLLGGSKQGEKGKPDTVSRAKTVQAVLDFAEASQRSRSRAPRGQPNNGSGN